MNKHKRALMNLASLAAIVFYATGVPYFIVGYGISNNIPAFDNGAPFGEVYSVFSAVWIFGNVLAVLVMFGLFGICYGSDEKGKS